MRKERLYGAAGCAALILAACGGGHDHGQGQGFTPIPPSWAPVSLLTLSDAERELANISTTLALTDPSTVAPAAAAAPMTRALGPDHALVRGFAPAAAAQPRAMPMPRVTDANCTAGGNDAVTSSSKSRAFSYFTLTATVNYTVDAYSNCANSSNGTTTTRDGLFESGVTTDSVYQYQALGDLNSGNTLAVFSDGPDANNNPLHTQQDFLGLLEAGSSGSLLDQRSNLFSTLFASQPNQPDYDGSFQIGDSGGVYEIISSGTSLNIGGTYAYASTACLGGAVTVTTPTNLGLGTTSAGSGLPVSGVLSIDSGSNSVSYSFNADGSATLSGSVSGTISAADVGRILQNGTSC